MTKTTLTLLAGLALAASAQAGEDYSAKSAKVVIPPPAPCLWTWFAGGSVGYLDEFDSEMYTLHVGAEYKCPTSSCSHAVYVEVGYADRNDGFKYDKQGQGYYNDVDIDTQLVPLTLNYKFECALTGNLNWYIGAGAGVAFIDVDATDTRYDTGRVTSKESESFDDTVFYGQLFAGLVYNFSDSFEAFGGGRYIYMTDDTDFDNYGDDWFYDLGFRFNF